MKKFTVILLRPDYLAAPGRFGQDVYVAFVEAENAVTAIEFAQDEVFRDDTTDGLDPESRDDYALILVLPDHVKPELWGREL